MDVRDEDKKDLEALLKALLSDPPKVLQVVAIAALIMGLGAAVAYYAQYVFPSDRSGGWGIASATFYIMNSAVYGPAVLLGFVALLLVRSDERRDQAIKMTRLIMIAVVLLALSGLGQVVSLVGSFLSDESSWMSGWYVASQALTLMGSAVFECGVLLGLVYIFRLQERRHASQRLSEDEAAAAAQSSGSHGIQ